MEEDLFLNTYYVPSLVLGVYVHHLIKSLKDLTRRMWSTVPTFPIRPKRSDVLTSKNLGSSWVC